MELCSAAEMRALDRAAIDDVGIPGVVLMENAGRLCAERIRETVPAAEAVWIFCGAGNNGGDGFVIARHLAERGVSPTIVLLADPGKLGGDTLVNFRICEALAIPIMRCADAASTDQLAIPETAPIVDAIFGTGLSKPLQGHYAAAVSRINRHKGPIFAVDIPSGINADTGAVMGVAVSATHTVSFALPKWGLLLEPGASHVGQLTVAEIGIPRQVVRQASLKGRIVDEADARDLVRPRVLESHKGTYGYVLIAAGTPGYSGAALLASEGALRVGAGIVTLATEASLRPQVEPLVRELLYRTLFDAADAPPDPARMDALLDGKHSALIGPGLGQSRAAATVTEQIIARAEVPLVVDADALNLLARHLPWLRTRRAATVLTPHPGEMARLLGSSNDEVQRDRRGAAAQFAKTQGVITVLKGHRTLIAAPDGRIAVLTVGNPGMASGGMGDVLAGMIAGMLGQYRDRDPFETTAVACYLHGRAADTARERVGEAALTASDVINTIGPVLAQWEQTRH